MSALPPIRPSALAAVVEQCWSELDAQHGGPGGFLEPLALDPEAARRLARLLQLYAADGVGRTAANAAACGRREARKEDVAMVISQLMLDYF